MTSDVVLTDDERYAVAQCIREAADGWEKEMWGPHPSWIRDALAVLPRLEGDNRV